MSMNHPLTEKQARALGKQIIKDAHRNVRIKFGKVNGRIVLHVYVPGSNSLARDISSYSEWENHPANERARRNDQFAATEATEKLMESNSPERAV